MKSIRSWIFVLQGTLLAVTMIACQDKQTVSPSYTCEGTLYDKPLDNIRACVKGEWKMLYYQGGIAVIKVETPDTYFTIRNDSIMTIESGSPYITSKISWDKVYHNYYGHTYLLTCKKNGYLAGGWIVVRRSSDTLELNDFGSDPFGYILVRKH